MTQRLVFIGARLRIQPARHLREGQMADPIPCEGHILDERSFRANARACTPPGHSLFKQTLPFLIAEYLIEKHRPQSGGPFLTQPSWNVLSEFLDKGHCHAPSPGTMSILPQEASTHRGCFHTIMLL